MFLENYKTNVQVLAGFLTFPVTNAFPSAQPDSGILLVIFIGSYSSGPVPDFHRLPY